MSTQPIIIGLCMSWFPYDKGQGLHANIEKLRMYFHPDRRRTLLFPSGEGVEKYDFNSITGRKQADNFVYACKALGTSCALVFDISWELQGKDQEMIAKMQASNAALLTFIRESGVQILTLTRGNELYSKAYNGWPTGPTYATPEKIAALQKFFQNYLSRAHFDGYNLLWAKDQMNKKETYWNDMVLAAKPKRITAHVYPEMGLVGDELKRKLDKRLGRALNAGIEVYVQEFNAHFGFNGTEPGYEGYSGSTLHKQQIDQCLAHFQYQGVKAVYLHKAGGLLSADNNYDFVKI